MLEIERATRRFLRAPLPPVLSARQVALRQMETNILKSDVLAEAWEKALEQGAVCRPHTHCSKRHWEKACKEFRDALHKYKDEHVVELDQQDLNVDQDCWVFWEGSWWCWWSRANLFWTWDGRQWWNYQEWTSGTW